MKRRLITHADYLRLNIVRDRAFQNMNKFDALDQFYSELRSAAVYRPEHISSRVVTMNSTVLLKDLKNDEEFQLTLTYPHHAKEEDRKISVFHHIGMALLGRVENDEVYWKTKNSLRRCQILKVVYQPEAVGDFYM